MLPTYTDIQTIISDWTDSITLVNNTIEIPAGSFPTNPIISVEINDFDNMPGYISLDRVEHTGNEGPGIYNDTLTFNPNPIKKSNL